MFETVDIIGCVDDRVWLLDELVSEERVRSLLTFSKGSLAAATATTTTSSTSSTSTRPSQSLDGYYGLASQQLRKRLYEASDLSPPLMGLAYVDAMESMWRFFGGPVGLDDLWRQTRKCLRKMGMRPTITTMASSNRHSSRDMDDMADDDSAIVHEDEVVEVVRMQATQLESVKMFGCQRFAG